MNHGEICNWKDDLFKRKNQINELNRQIKALNKQIKLIGTIDFAEYIKEIIEKEYKFHCAITRFKTSKSVLLTLYSKQATKKTSSI